MKKWIVEYETRSGERKTGEVEADTEFAARVVFTFSFYGCKLISIREAE